MLIKLAWKNIWRNKVRSGVILSAIAIGLFAGTYLAAFMEGWIIGTVKESIDTDIACIQIHSPKFLANYDVREYLQGFPDVAEMPDETTISGRIVLAGMLQSANNALGITAKGVIPEQEKTVSAVWKTIPDSMGVYLPDDIKMPIVISKKTAGKLKVHLKSKIVFTFQNANEEMQSVAFRVCGIYKTSNSMFDENAVFVKYDDIFPLTALPENAIHEVAVNFPDLKTCDWVYPKIKAALPGLEVLSWKEINPTLSLSLGATEFFGAIIIGIFLLALSFGIVNTMLMAILERTKELGMLKAIGMSKNKIFRMIMFETVFLTFLGSVAGIILATIVLTPSLKTGIDLTFMMGDTFEDYGFSAIVYPVINLKMFVEIAVLVIFAGILSAIYPARRALKINTIEAIKTE
ncbi:MAG: FtsX-like permease family protein [Tannerellaceae bacterium]|jgi:ABC-type lipoprotein release transport system permease subunit|nr:FtsX-like permease family protein [Tannerellaceae bacterium]